MNPSLDRLLEMIGGVASAANEATSGEEAFRAALEEISAATGSEVGHVYLVAPGPPAHLEDSGTWWPGADSRFEPLRRALTGRPLGPKEGAAGPAWATRTPIGTTIADDPALPGSEPALEAGLRSTLAAPVWVGEEIVAVVELFSSRDHATSEDVLDALDVAGVVLGRVVERAQAEAALQRALREPAAPAPAADAVGTAGHGPDRIRDELTGLFTERFQEEALLIETSRAGRSRRQVGVIALGIDELEESKGRGEHAAVEASVKVVGGFLLESVRTGDIPARWGDDFVIVLAGVGTGMGRAKAQQLLKGVTELRVGPASGGSLTASAGLASFPESGAKPRTLVEAALEAMRRAQAAGGNRVQLAQASTERWSEPTESQLRKVRSRP